MNEIFIHLILKFNFLIIIDYKSFIFIFLIRIIFSIIIIYRIRYTDLRELKINRFLYLIILFLISIILRPNILSIILGWDELGLISYCLVIYYIKIKSFTSVIVIIILNLLDWYWIIINYIFNNLLWRMKFIFL